MKAVIIDDEKNSAEALKYLLQRHEPEVVISEVCADGISGIKAIRNHQPDVVFLDIEMPELSGFDVLEKIGEYHFEIIFTTAYNQYAIKAIQYSALDYLLKPIDVNLLHNAIQRVKHKKSKQMRVEQMRLFFEYLNGQPNSVHRLALPTLDGLIFVDSKDIVRCQSSSNYTHVFMLEGIKYVVSKTLKDIESMLEQSRFCRIHNSHLINLDHVQRYVRTDGGYVIMTDNTQVEISRRKKEDFLEMMGLHHE